MPKLGIGELLVIFLIITLLFGARRLPELAKSLSQAIKEFKKAGKEDTSGKEVVNK